MTTSMRLLQGRTAVITGAGGGIGRGVSLALAQAGCNIIVAARRLSTGDETAALVTAEGGRCLAVQCDVTQETDVSRCIKLGVQEFGGIDIAVHNANPSSSSFPVPMESITAEAFSADARVTWDGAFWLARETFPYLKQSVAGRFILLGSVFGLIGAGYNPIYSGLKGGFRGLSKSLAREWGAYAITVHAIQPAAATLANTTYFDENPEFRDAYLKNFPLGRMGDPREDIGGAVVALCSDGFGYVTAQSIQVDGGLYTAM